MRAHAFPAARRVRKRRDFVRAYDAGRRAHGRRMIVFVRPNAGPASRLGVTATRKFGNAVARNRARRLVREAFRTAGDALPAGMDIVVVARKRMLGAGAPAVRRELLQLLESLSGPAS